VTINRLEKTKWIYQYRSGMKRKDYLGPPTIRRETSPMRRITPISVDASTGSPNKEANAVK
jgi:hypothetical protein